MADELKRIDTTDKALLTASTEELLLAGNKDEIFRRAWNAYVKKQTKA